MAEWTDVQTGVPTKIDWDGESSVNVLVLQESGQILIGFYVADPGLWCDDLGDMLDVEDPVTHWMPLPEPPK